MSKNSSVLGDAVTSTGAGNWRPKQPGAKAGYQVVGTTSSGSGAAIVRIEVANSESATVGVEAGTISLTLGTTATTDGFTSEDGFAFVRYNVTSISGTGASVTISVGG